MTPHIPTQAKKPSNKKAKTNKPNDASYKYVHTLQYTDRTCLVGQYICTYRSNRYIPLYPAAPCSQDLWPYTRRYGRSSSAPSRIYVSFLFYAHAYAPMPRRLPVVEGWEGVLDRAFSFSFPLFFSFFFLVVCALFMWADIFFLVLMRKRGIWSWKNGVIFSG